MVSQLLHVSTIFLVLCTAAHAAWQDNIKPKRFVQLGEYLSCSYQRKLETPLLLNVGNNCYTIRYYNRHIYIYPDWSPNRNSHTFVFNELSHVTVQQQRYLAISAGAAVSRVQCCCSLTAFTSAGDYLSNQTAVIASCIINLRRSGWNITLLSDGVQEGKLWFICVYPANVQACRLTNIMRLCRHVSH